MNDFDNISLIKDKDKLFVVMNICITGISIEKAMHMLLDYENNFSNKFDDTVKFFVIPVLDPTLQKMEILNPRFVDDNLIKELKEKYENLLSIIKEKYNK